MNEIDEAHLLSDMDSLPLTATIDACRFCSPADLVSWIV